MSILMTLEAEMKNEDAFNLPRWSEIYFKFSYAVKVSGTQVYMNVWNGIGNSHSLFISHER